MHETKATLRHAALSSTPTTQHTASYYNPEIGYIRACYPIKQSTILTQGATVGETDRPHYFLHVCSFDLVPAVYHPLTPRKTSYCFFNCWRQAPQLVCLHAVGIHRTICTNAQLKLCADADKLHAHTVKFVRLCTTIYVVVPRSLAAIFVSALPLLFVTW